MQVLTAMEVRDVSGGDWGSATGALAVAYGTGAASFGASWGAVGVGLAFAASPLTVIAVVGLAAYAGYQMVSK